MTEYFWKYSSVTFEVVISWKVAVGWFIEVLVCVISLHSEVVCVCVNVSFTHTYVCFHDRR